MEETSSSFSCTCTRVNQYISWRFYNQPSTPWTLQLFHSYSWAAVHVLLLVHAYTQRLFSYKLRQLCCNVMTVLYYMPKETDLSGQRKDLRISIFLRRKTGFRNKSPCQSRPTQWGRPVTSAPISPETGCVLSTCRPPPPRSGSWSLPPTPECSPCAVCRPRSPPGYLQHKPPQTRPQDHEIKTID